MASKPSIKEIQATLMDLARADMSPQKLLKTVRKAHPQASKKDIVRAAFASVIQVADSDTEKAVALQNFAIQERGGDDDG